VLPHDFREQLLVAGDDAAGLAAGNRKAFQIVNEGGNKR
jgi:hypothetical protein